MHRQHLVALHSLQWPTRLSGFFFIHAKQVSNVVTLITISNVGFGILFHASETGKGMTFITISNVVFGILIHTSDTYTGWAFVAMNHVIFRILERTCATCDGVTYVAINYNVVKRWWTHAGEAYISFTVITMYLNLKIAWSQTVNASLLVAHTTRTQYLSLISIMTLSK